MNLNRSIFALVCLLAGNVLADAAEELTTKAPDSVTDGLRSRVALALKQNGKGHHLTRQAWIDLAHHYTDHERYNEAAELWKLIATSREDSLGSKSGLTADAFFQYGHMLARSRRFLEAEKALEHCVGLCPIKPGDGGLFLDYYGLLSYVQCELKYWTKARQTCRMWLALRHTHTDTEARAHRNMAIALSGMQAHEEARLEMELAILHDPAWGTIDCVKGMEAQLDYSKILRGGGNLEGSEKILRRIVASAASNSQGDLPVTLRGCHELALCLRQLGNEVEARTLSKRAFSGMQKWMREMVPWHEDIEQLYQQLHDIKQKIPSK